MNTARVDSIAACTSGRGKLVLAQDRLERGLPRHDGLDGLGLDRQDDVRALRRGGGAVLALTHAAAGGQHAAASDERGSRSDDPGEVLGPSIRRAV